MKIKLLYLPRYDMDYNTGNYLPFSTYAFIPPVGMPVLTSFLKANSIKVEQDDLLVKVYRKNLELIQIFCDENKRKKFLENGYEEELEEAGEKILNLTKVKGFDVIGFSLYEPDNPTTGIIALVIAKILKERHDPTIIFGGRVWGYMREFLLKSDFIDYGIIHSPFDGPAELNLLKFCETYENGKDLEEKVPGLEYVSNGKIRVNRPYYDKNEIVHFVTPCFDGLPLDLYKYGVSCKVDGNEYSSEILVLPYFFTKGCPFKCAFCCNSILPGVVLRPPDEVARDLEYLKKRYKTKYFFFLNTTINPSYNYAKEVAKALRDVDIKFSDSANFVPLDKKLLTELKDAGAVRLMFGLESGSQKILKFVGKNFTIPQAEKILRDAYEVGIWSELSLICGFPHERNDDVKKTLIFLEKNRKYIKSAYINKFFLDGKIRQNPKEYGIRIKEEEFEPKETLREEWRGGFDETGGLKWKERKRLTDKTFDLILRAMKKFGIVRGSELHEIFFLNSSPEWEEIVRGGMRVRVRREFS